MGYFTGSPQDSETQSHHRLAVLRTLAKHRHPVSRTRLRDESGLRNEELETILAKLIDEGQVTRNVRRFGRGFTVRYALVH